MRSNILSLGKLYFHCYLGLSRESWRGIIFSLFESMLIGIFYFLSIYFVNDLKLSVASSGFVISFYGVGAILGSYFGGVLTDKFSPDPISAIGLSLQAMCYLALIWISTLNYLMVDVFILGIASYSFITSNHLSVLNSCKGRETQRVKALNLLATASNLGSGMSGLLLGYFLYFGFHNVFLVTGVLLFFLSVVVVMSRQRLLGNQRAVHDAATSNSATENREEQYNKTSIWIVLFSVFSVGAVVAQLGTSYPLYIKEIFPGDGVKAVSILFALNSFIVVFFATPFGEICNRYNKLLMVGVGGFLICLGMFMLAFASTFFIALLACVVFTLGEMIFFSMAQYVVYHSGDIKKRGKSLGLFRCVYASSRVMGPLAGGMLYEYYGGSMVWYVSGMIGMLCLLSCVSIPSGKRAR